MIPTGTATGVNPTQARGPAPLNPERPPALLGKYAKVLGKELDKIVVTYDSDGTTVEVFGMDGTPFASLKEASVASYKAKKVEVNAPTMDEKLRAFRNKFELRLNREFPKEGPSSGSDEDIQEFMDTLNFRERRALLMTQKQFSTNYPNGYSQA